MSERYIDVFADADQLSEAAATNLVEHARQAVADRGRFLLALAGGSTPKKLYQLLTTSPWRDQINWQHWHVFLGDERMVPPEHKDSNYGMARDALLAHVPLDAVQIHPVPTDAGSPDDVASRYEAELRGFLTVSAGEWPRFDLVLLGMGSDGHTASLFPGMPSLDETARMVVASPPGVLPPPVDRITLTLPVINAARAVAFLVAGADKRDAFAPVRDGTSLGDAGAPPAARVQPTNGELRWFVDTQAAGEG